MPRRNEPGAEEFFKKRVQERESIPIPNIWSRSPSPKPQKKVKSETNANLDHGEESQNGTKENRVDNEEQASEEGEKSKKVDNERSDNDNSSSSSEEESSGSDHKRKKRKRKSKQKKSRSRSPSRSGKRKHKSKNKRRRKDKKHRSKKTNHSQSEESASDEQSEGNIGMAETNATAVSSLNNVEPSDTAAATASESAPTESKDIANVSQEEEESDDDDDVVGPKLSAAQLNSAKSGGNYGGALRPGEGAAIASYVQQNKRIPRRGEVGWTGEEIEQLENMGYVMSGSRHKRMNEVRLRKENQVYSAEEKSALALFNYEEKQQRENQLMAEFRKMLAQRDMGPDAGQEGTENADTSANGSEQNIQ